MKIHALKCQDVFFQQIVDGQKPFEVRFQDRDFSVGDILALNEVCVDAANLGGGTTRHTGRCCLVKVTAILDNPQFCKEGYVVLGIRPSGLIPDSDDLFGCRKRSVYEVPVYGGDE